ncbi:hypothetical protein [Actinoplanes auranticolor]|uniref:Uncharacterized protein n=1 Tax=Actinoplanes auranticolor TaxID=47988 RepID=A0A919SCH7_9ACTN|nr:hypothetical protein [Actinoplanes auranticolor]GIM68043.1 hypothetical protein Aau02nite_29860 [Actinoplanes auranticolor]
MRQHDERDLRTALREEADRHRPDRQAMLDRIAQGRAAYARRPIDRLFALVRPAAAALAVAVVLVLAVAGVRLSSREPEVDDAPVAAPSAVPATTPAPATTSAPKPSTATATSTAPKPPRTTTGTSSPASTTPATPSSRPAETDRDGYLSSTGQLDPNTSDGWSQDSVTLESARKLTALDVTVEVALTPGVAETGKWTTVSTELLTISINRTSKHLVFRFTLRPGATLAPGKYTFAGQFNHAAGKRPPTADSYRAKVTGDGKDAKVSGNFTPQQ